MPDRLGEGGNHATVAAAPPAQRQSIWWLFLLQGNAAIILGLMRLTAPGATLVVMVTSLGFYWLIEGTARMGSLVAAILTLIFLPAVYVAPFRVREPAQLTAP
jgi:uncharacterized membrane protein HdeD (DUF308 family)